MYVCVYIYIEREICIMYITNAYISILHIGTRQKDLRLA